MPHRTGNCVEYYDFNIEKKLELEPNATLKAEDRSGRKVSHAAELLTTETGEIIMRVYIPPMDVRYAGDLDSTHLGKVVDISGVVGEVAQIQHHMKDGQPFTFVIWRGEQQDSYVPSRSSARVVD